MFHTTSCEVDRTICMISDSGSDAETTQQEGTLYKIYQKRLEIPC